MPTKKSRDKLIKEEVKRLEQVFKPKMSSDKYQTVLGLIENASFMKIQMTEMQGRINEDGVTVKYQNGENQWGYKKSPDVETYNSFIKQYTTIIKQLTELLPQEFAKDSDDLDEFINDRDD